MGALFRGQSGLWFPGQVKPQGIPRIDWNHPLAQGLLFYGFDTGTGLIVDLVGFKPQLAIPGTTAARVGSTPWGTGFLWNKSDGRAFASDAAIQAASASGNFSFAQGFVQTGGQGNDARSFGRTAGNNSLSPFLNWNFNLSHGGSGDASLSVQFLTTSGIDITSNWTVDTTNVICHALASFISTGGSGNGVLNLYAGGVLQEAKSLSHPVSSGNTNDAIIFSGGSAAGSDSPINGYLPYGAMWGRTLSATEALQLALDPYCFLMPAEGEWPALYLPSSGVVYTPAAGSLAITGRTPSTSGAASVSPAAGSIALSGKIPSIANAITLTPGAGALNLTGLTPSLSNAVSFSPGAGSLTLTGNVPSATAVASLSVGLGSFAITGYAPTYTNGTGTTYTVGLGSLAITGLIPSATAASTLRAGLGGMIFSGQYPTVYAWFDVAPNSESWTPASSGNTTWIATSPTVESWSSVSPIIDPWTKLPPSSGWS